MTIGIVDYGVNNLCSVAQALVSVGATAEVAESPGQLAHVDRIILPGVGGFGAAMSELAGKGWRSAIRERVDRGTPLLGICLGMQLLADRGTEGGDVEGLGLIPGIIVRLDELGCRERIPHVGWNSVAGLRDEGLFAGIPEHSDFYFVHSYAFSPADGGDVLAFTDYGVSIPAAVRRGHVFGTQFHPEKSSRAGLRLLRNFVEMSVC